jgi:hypothetical protein
MRPPRGGGRFSGGRGGGGGRFGGGRGGGRGFGGRGGGFRDEGPPSEVVGSFLELKTINFFLVPHNFSPTVNIELWI